jgi:hypothetical protein
MQDILREAGTARRIGVKRKAQHLKRSEEGFSLHLDEDFGQCGERQLDYSRGNHTSVGSSPYTVTRRYVQTGDESRC